MSAPIKTGGLLSELLPKPPPRTLLDAPAERTELDALRGGPPMTDEEAASIRLDDYLASKAHAARRAAEKRALIELARANQDEDVRPVEWLIDRVLARDAFTLMIGSEFAGKTWIALSQALAIAAGIPWCGFATTRGSVLLVLQDGNQAVNRQRLRRLAMAMGLDLETLMETGQIVIYPYRLLTDDATALEQFTDFVAKLQPALVVVDNLSRLRANEEATENDNVKMAALVKPLEAVELGCACQLLHHPNGRTGESRGGKAVPAAADVEWRVKRASDDMESAITMTSRSRFAGETKIVLRFLGTDENAPVRVERLERTPRAHKERPAEPEAPRQAPVPADPRAALRERMIAALTGQWLNATELNAAVGGRPANAIAMRKELESEGVIACLDGLYGLA